MSAETLLVEIRTQELPPKISGELAADFANSLLESLQKADFADAKSACSKNGDKNKRFVTSRRLAAVLHDIRAESPAKQVSRRGPQMSACHDADGAPTKALIGFMHSVGATCENDLTEITENGKRYVAWEGQAAGRKLADDLAPMVQKVLLSLSAPRLMRWGDNDFRFIRPVLGVLMMHGKNVIDGTVINVAAAKTTKGHPILSTGEISVASADDYETTMRDRGMVIVDEDARREEIKNQLWRAAEEKNCRVNLSSPDTKQEVEDLYDTALLHEVAGMCEYPTVYAGEMRGIESLPDFCVVGCLKKHQRFFAAYDQSGKLNRTCYFVVADNKPENPALMLAGFNSVLRARLCDLDFYYTEDKKHSDEYYLERLKNVVYHSKLGSQDERVCRIQTIAQNIAAMMNLDDKQKKLLAESAKLCKADLTTLVIGEYPDMEGKMAAKYFCADEVADIVHEHNATLYEIGLHFANFDSVPRAYWSLLLADNLEKLVGLFGVGEKPTGSKDPHGLRLAAFKIMFVLQEVEVQLAGDELLETVRATFDELPQFDLHEVWSFIVARMFMLPISKKKSAWQMQIGMELQKAVSVNDNFFLADIHSRRQAVRHFAVSPEAEILVAAGKRINNIFRKSGVEPNSFSAPDDNLFEDKAERALHDSVIKLIADTAKQTSKGDYVEALKTLTHAAKPVDEFFNNVMVNAKDEKVRHNRFALLNELRTLLNCVTKLS